MRLPEEVHQRMVEAAKRARRSLNGQVVRVLERWLEEREGEDESGSDERE